MDVEVVVGEQPREEEDANVQAHDDVHEVEEVVVWVRRLGVHVLVGDDVDGVLLLEGEGDKLEVVGVCDSSFKL